jgi:hypothetical protein
MKVRFWMSDKTRETMLADAFKSGVTMHGDEFEVRSLGEPFTPDCNVAIMVGVKSKELWRQHTRAGIQLVYQDKGYSRHSRKDDIRGWEYWRCAVNSHQPTSKFRVDYPSDRRENQGWEYKSWRKSGGHIIIAGSSAKYHDFYDLRNPTDWAGKLVKFLHKAGGGRPVVYRPKPSWHDAVPIEGTRFSAGSEAQAKFTNGRIESIDEVLKGAHCVVTHGSNACFEAMLAGIPTIVLGDAVMKPISSTSEEKIQSPMLAKDKDRDAILNFLAYQQWTMLEHMEGKAWPVIRRQFFE